MMKNILRDSFKIRSKKTSNKSSNGWSVKSVNVQKAFAHQEKSDEQVIKGVTTGLNTVSSKDIYMTLS